MEAKYISLIVIIAFFLVLIAIFGVLSLVFYQKHKPYRQLRNEYLKQFQDLKDQPLKLEPISTNITLPTDEAFYLIRNDVEYYEQIVKDGWKPLNAKLAFEMDEADYNLVEQKSNYSLSNRAAKYYRNNQTGDLLVTNKRCLLKQNQKLVEIPLLEVKKIVPTIMTVKKNHFLGIIIYTNEKLYRIKDNDWNDLLILQSLLTKAKGEDNHD